MAAMTDKIMANGNCRIVKAIWTSANRCASVTDSAKVLRLYKGKW